MLLAIWQTAQMRCAFLCVPHDSGLVFDICFCLAIAAWSVCGFAWAIISALSYCKAPQTPKSHGLRGNTSSYGKGKGVFVYSEELPKTGTTTMRTQTAHCNCTNNKQHLLRFYVNHRPFFRCIFIYALQLVLMGDSCGFRGSSMNLTYLRTRLCVHNEYAALQCIFGKPHGKWGCFGCRCE